MATKADLQHWVVEALEELGGPSSVLAVTKVIWANHSEEIKSSGDLFYTWQYDLRWAAYNLRKQGIMKQADDKAVPWELK